MTNEVSRKPCPFCGSSDLEGVHKPDPSPPSYPDGVWVIECFGCGALGPFCEEHQNATKAWNDRGQSEPKAPQKDWPTLAVESYERNSETAALRRVIERHAKWRETALGFLRQVIDGRGSEDEWPALAEFVERSDQRMVESSSVNRNGVV